MKAQSLPVILFPDNDYNPLLSLLPQNLLGVQFNVCSMNPLRTLSTSLKGGTLVHGKDSLALGFVALQGESIYSKCYFDTNIC